MTDHLIAILSDNGWKGTPSNGGKQTEQQGADLCPQSMPQILDVRPHLADLPRGKQEMGVSILKKLHRGAAPKQSQWGFPEVH